MPPEPNAVQAPAEDKWCFGSLVLWEMQRRLERRGRAVRLGSRSLDLLLHLLKHPGEVVSKEELLASVWSGVVVEDGSVRVHMSILRKALGAPEPEDGCLEWIATIPLRGYRFVGRVHREPADCDAALRLGLVDPAQCVTALSGPFGRLINHTTTIDATISAVAMA